jgi:hypothetical protein
MSGIEMLLKIPASGDEALGREGPVTVLGFAWGKFTTPGPRSVTTERMLAIVTDGQSVSDLPLSWLRPLPSPHTEKGE